MKAKYFYSFFLVFLLTGKIFAQEIYLPVYQPFTPEVLAQGSSNVAVARGWNALFSNPAGFSRESNDSFYLVMNTSAFLRFQDISDFVGFIRDGSFDSFDIFGPPPNPVLNFFSDLVTQNGIGMSETLGLGYISKGLALALVVDSNLYGKGESLMGTNALFTSSLAAIIGYSVAVPFFFAGEPNLDPLLTEDGEVDAVAPDMVLHVGGSLKIMHYYYSEYSVLNLLSMLSGSALDMTHPVYTFPYFSLSLGTLLEWTNFTFGLSVNDAGNGDPGDRLNGLDSVVSSFLFPTTGTKDTQVFILPMTVRAGFGWTPDFGEYKDVISPKVHMEMRIPITGNKTPSWLTWWHFGGEVVLVNFLSLRAGWSSGNLTAGAGFRFFDLWEISASFSTMELGQRIGEISQSRFMIESSLKF